MPVRTFFTLSLVVAVLLLCVGPSLIAQTLTTGEVNGTVYDTTKAVIPNAPITLNSLDSGTTQTTASNAVGFYSFKLLKPGRYEISAKVT